MKVHKPPSDVQLGSVDYEGIESHVQDTLEESMNMIVSSVEAGK